MTPSPNTPRIGIVAQTFVALLCSLVVLFTPFIAIV